MCNNKSARLLKRRALTSPIILGRCDVSHRPIVFSLAPYCFFPCTFDSLFHRCPALILPQIPAQTSLAPAPKPSSFFAHFFPPYLHESAFLLKIYGQILLTRNAARLRGVSCKFLSVRCDRFFSQSNLQSADLSQKSNFSLLHCQTTLCATPATSLRRFWRRNTILWRNCAPFFLC